MEKTETRVRFAPSPTGMLHIGGARTAIYNWAFARATGGTFILRIEDTDPERSTEENTQIILRAMRWLGLDWDEGPEVGGSVGPYFQTQRAETYVAVLEKLIAAGAAYPCFCSKEQLDEDRAAAEKTSGGYAGYVGRCRDLDPDEAKKRIEAGEAHVWRLRVPKDHAPIAFDDAVYGHMEFPADVMDDLVLVRTDGSPTYNFANVCDDSNMGITHVIRGDDHLSNTPRQILIYEALGLKPPTFAHLPMILGPDGKKLSKRHGATNVEEYRDRGFLPDAMVNFLALLGWSLDGETTIIPREKLCSEFSLDRITKKDSIFDEKKLNWMNGVYIREMSPEKWVYEATPWLAKAMITGSDVPAGVTVVQSANANASGAQNSNAKDAGTEGGKNPQASDEDASNAAQDPSCGVDPEKWQAALAAVSDDVDWFKQVCPLVIERMERFDELPEKLAYLFWGASVEVDSKSAAKVLEKEGARADESLKLCRQVLSDAGIPWEVEPLEEKCRALGDEAGIKVRNLLQPLRVAVCGNMVSPPLFESIVLMNRDDVIARIDGVLAHFFEGK